MPKLSVRRSLTSKILRVYIQKISDGRPLTGLLFNTASLTAYYILEGAAAPVQITLVTATVGTWTSGGFKEIDATNLPGWYELHLPNAALASGNSVGGMLKGASDMLECPFELALDAVDVQDTVRMGLTALPNAAAGANGGLPLGNASGQTTVATVLDKTGYSLSAGGVQAIWDALTSALTTVGSVGKRISDNLDVVLSSRASSAALATVQADTDDLQTRVPAALVGGRIDASVGAMAAGTITAAAHAANAIDANALAADAATEIGTAVWASGTRTLSAFGFTVSVDLTQTVTDVGGAANTLGGILSLIRAALNGKVTIASAVQKMFGQNGTTQIGVDRTFTGTVPADTTRQ